MRMNVPNFELRTCNLELFRLHLKPRQCYSSSRHFNLRERREKLESGLKHLLKRRARGLVLLVLLAHAFVVSATHFHVVAGLDASRASGAALTRPDESRKAPLTGGEEQCLVCRLQRNFNNGLMQHATPEVASPLAKSLVFPSLEQASAHSAQRLSATGRAPPLS